MKVINYRVTLLEPTLVTSLQGDPNSAVAFDYLPGSVLRGIFIGKYLGSKSADASDGTLRRLFFDGTTRYLNGYPLDVYEHPSLPVPASWRRVKGCKNEIFDFAVEPQNDDQQWQPVSEPFYTQTKDGENVWLIRPARNVTIHTQRTVRFGRAMSEYPANSTLTNKRPPNLLEADDIAGTVYRYDALAAGQTFQATIICDNDNDEPTLRALIGGHVTLGGSRSSGYGRAKIEIAKDHSAWDMTEDAEDPPEDKLIFTLQSDALLRDTRGQFAVDPELLRQVLGRHLGEVELKLEDAFLGTETIGGFNRKWRLPLPQALAVRMGSVLIFKDPGCDLTLLNNLEARGIGERRAEGFGRIAFNRQRATKLMASENNRKSKSPAVSTINDTEARAFAELMVNRMLRQRLDEELLAAANTIQIINPPSNAQISNLRAIVLEELRKAAPDTNKICQFISSIKTRGSARRQFEHSIVDGKPLFLWLEDLLRCNNEGVWTMDDNDWKNQLHLEGTEVSIKIGGVKAKIDDTLRLEYVLRLIDLVLAHAAKQRGKEN